MPFGQVKTALLVLKNRESRDRVTIGIEGLEIWGATKPIAFEFDKLKIRGGGGSS